MFLAIDPGLNSPGVALFKSDVLIAAARIRVPDEFAEFSPGERWCEVAQLIARWVMTLDDILHVVFERPQWYARGKSKGDPNQLAGVAGVAAAVCGILTGVNGDRPLISSPTPAEWIGQLSKVCPACKGKAKKKCAECRGSAWETPRGRFIRKRLSEAELALVPDQNDAIDAVGLGLFILGRLKPRSVLSNGRDGR